MRAIECHTGPEQSTPRASSPADFPETAVASTDAPTQDAPTRAQSGTASPCDATYSRSAARSMTAVIRAGRTVSGLLAQKVDRENDARLALVQAELSGDPTRIRLATEALAFHASMHDAALLDLVYTVQLAAGGGFR